MYFDQSKNLKKTRTAYECLVLAEWLPWALQDAMWLILH